MKKYLLGLFAVALAIGFSAFSTVDAEKEAAFTNYYFDITNDGTGFDDITAWVPLATATSSACSGSSSTYCQAELSSTQSEVEFDDDDNVRPVQTGITVSSQPRTKFN